MAASRVPRGAPALFIVNFGAGGTGLSITAVTPEAAVKFAA